MLLTFSNFFRQCVFRPILLEMNEKEIEKIEDSIMDVEERPFSELFGNKERFIEKVYSPEFLKLLEEFNFNLYPKGFDIDNGFYIDSKGNKYRFGELFKKIEKTEAEGDDPERVKTRISKLKQMLNQKTIYNYMVFSRHPIDVLRMSDINEIESCHSQGRMYFDCAINEAKNLGGIVYIIDKQAKDKVKDHLNDREIFEDPERGIKGIKPKARIRLRRFINNETGEDFAVPEKTYYVPKGNVYGYDDRFIDDILQYTKDHQKISKEKLDPDYIEQNIAHVGGQYSDTDFSTLLSRFFGMNDYDIGSIKSHTSIPLTNKKILSILQELEKSNNPEEILPKVDADKAFNLLKGITYWESQGEFKFPRSKEYILNLLNNANIDSWDHREGLKDLITSGVDISRYPKIIEKILGSLNDIFYDMPYNSSYDIEGIKNFIATNSDGIKNYFKTYPFQEASFYRIRDKVEPLVTFLQQKGDPTNLVKWLKQFYFTKMADLDISNRNNIRGFYETFGESLFKYIDETHQWEEFLTIGGSFYPYENWFEKSSGRYEMLQYPAAIQTILNLMNSSIQQGDTNVLTFSRLLANGEFSKYVSENPNIYGNAFQNIIKKLVSLDLVRISDLKYYLAISGLIEGNSPEVAEELGKYKQNYINAFRDTLNKHRKYISEDYLQAITRVLDRLRDNYGWYELKNSQDGPLDIIDDIRRTRNQQRSPNDVKL